MRSLALWLSCLSITACGGDDGGGGGGDGGGSRDASTADARTDGDGAPIEGDAATGQTCAALCDQIEELCVGELRQYANKDECLTTCALYPPGEPGDHSENTLSCRLYHADLAIADPVPHCYHAGPSGGRAGACGTACENYCLIMMPTCPDEFADEAECLEICAGYPDPDPYSIFESRTDTVACRIFHATRATADDGHCGTASPDSSTCVE